MKQGPFWGFGLAMENCAKKPGAGFSQQTFFAANQATAKRWCLWGDSDFTQHAPGFRM
jgi:hypothetical protein